MLKSQFEEYVTNNDITFEAPRLGKYSQIAPNFYLFLCFCGEQYIDPGIGFENLQNDNEFFEEFRAWYRNY
jgi:hypothetical protein